MPVIGVSIAIPEPWGGDLQRARVSYGDDQAEGIPTHITVLPPTELDDAEMARVDAHLAEAAAQSVPFTVELRGTGTFRPVSPVVFVQVAQGIPSCEQLEARVRTGLLDRELSFTYHPHVTVAQAVAEDQLERAYTELADFGCRFEVEEFFLYIQGDDEVWRPVRRYRLAGKA